MADGRQSRAFVLSSQLLATKFSPCLNSPAESEFGFAGTDEDDGYDFVSELTRQVAQDMREDYRTAARSIVGEKDEKSWGLVGSPESTLWSPLGSSKGSWEGGSLDPSPPPTSPIGAVEISHSEILFDTRASQLYKLKQEQITRLESCLRRRKDVEVPQFAKKQTDVWAESGRRSAFSGGSGSRNWSSGTGVFLPREIESPPSSSRKKQECSTILIPARVVQALKLHHDKTGTNSRLDIGGIPPQQDALMSLRGGVYGRRSWTTSATGHSQKGPSLPQEWTH